MGKALETVAAWGIWAVFALGLIMTGINAVRFMLVMTTAEHQSESTAERSGSLLVASAAVTVIAAAQRATNLFGTVWDWMMAIENFGWRLIVLLVGILVPLVIVVLLGRAGGVAAHAAYRYAARRRSVGH